LNRDQYSNHVIVTYSLATFYPCREMSTEIPSQLREYVDKAVLNASSGSWSFTQGFLLGQFTVLLVVLAFVKFMLFETVQYSTKKVHTCCNDWLT
jgi:hypothetical protein